MGSVTTGRARPAEQLGVELPVPIRVTEYRLRHGHPQTDGCWRDASSRQWDACRPICGRFVVTAPDAPPRSGSSRAGWWSATSATTSASPGPSPTRCCWPFAHEGTAAAVEAVYTEAVGAPSVGLEEPLGLRSCFSRRSIRLGSLGLCSTLGLLSPTGASASGCHLSGGFARHGLDLCLGGFGVSHNGVA